MKTNYHTHTTRCQHAVGTDREYVQAAVDAGFDVLGFSDHSPFPYTSYISRIRMLPEEFPQYRSSLESLREEFAGQIVLHIGLEAEYFPRYRDHLLRLREQGADYFILGQHSPDSDEDHPYTGADCQTDDGVRRYADAVALGISTGLYCCVAHPDLLMRHRSEDEFNAACMEASDTICQAASEAGIPIEYNLLGLALRMSNQERGYPSPAFWQYARRWNNDVILGVDAHDPAQLLKKDVWDAGAQHIASLNYHILDRLPMDGTAV